LLLLCVLSLVLLANGKINSKITKKLQKEETQSQVDLTVLGSDCVFDYSKCACPSCEWDKIKCTNNVANACAPKFTPQTSNKKANYARQSPRKVVASTATLDPKLCVETSYADVLELNGNAKQMHAKALKIQITQSENFKITVVKGDKKHEYLLLEFHFHTPGEHLVDGDTPAPAVVHLVHTAKTSNRPAGFDDYAVLEVNFASSPTTTHEFITAIKAAAAAGGPPEHDTAFTKSVKLNLNKLIPNKKPKFLNYAGGLTTPPCAQKVDWFILRLSPCPTIKADVKTAIQTAYGSNARPAQSSWNTNTVYKNAA